MVWPMACDLSTCTFPFLERSCMNSRLFLLVISFLKISECDSARMNTQKSVDLGNFVLHEHSYSSKGTINTAALNYFRQILVQEEHNYCKEQRDIGDKRDVTSVKWKKLGVNEKAKIRKPAKKIPQTTMNWQNIKETLEFVDPYTIKMRLPEELLKESEDLSRRAQRLEDFAFADEMPARQETHKFDDFDFEKYL